MRAVPRQACQVPGLPSRPRPDVQFRPMRPCSVKTAVHTTRLRAASSCLVVFVYRVYHILALLTTWEGYHAWISRFWTASLGSSLGSAIDHSFVNQFPDLLVLQFHCVCKHPDSCVDVGFPLLPGPCYFSSPLLQSRSNRSALRIASYHNPESQHQKWAVGGVMVSNVDSATSSKPWNVTADASAVITPGLARDASINTIPVAALHSIFACLNPKDLARVSCVCTLWRDLNRDEESNRSWRKFYMARWAHDQGLGVKSWQKVFGMKMLRLRAWGCKPQMDSLYGHKAGVRSLKLLPSHNLLVTGEEPLAGWADWGVHRLTHSCVVLAHPVCQPRAVPHECTSARLHYTSAQVCTWCCLVRLHTALASTLLPQALHPASTTYTHHALHLDLALTPA